MAARSLGLQISQRGRPSPSPTLLVANHISWLDIIAISSQKPARFVAKQEVQYWPVIGFLGIVMDTVFLNRNSRRDMRTAIDRLAERLKAGESIVIFPEATTTNGRDVGKFHQGLFESACISQAVTQPIAISYYINGKADYRVAPYIDNDSFIDTLLRLMRTPASQVMVSYLTPIVRHKQTRAQLCSLSHKQIQQEIEEADEVRQAA